MIIRRYFEIANKWTFQIKPIAELLKKYNVGNNWVDPFAGMNSPAELTNDINPKANAKYNMDARDFVNSLSGRFDGVVFDPPYSYRQISEHYAKNGIKASQLDTSFKFYNDVMLGIYKKIHVNGYAISFGWNSNGFGKRLGFKIIEIMIIAHGMHHNDTIATVEQKVKENYDLFENLSEQDVSVGMETV